MTTSTVSTKFMSTATLVNAIVKGLLTPSLTKNPGKPNNSTIKDNHKTPDDEYGVS